MHLEPMPPSTLSSNSFGVNVLWGPAELPLKFSLASPEGSARQSRSLSDEGETTSRITHGFTSGPLPSHPLRHQGTQQFILVPDDLN